MKPLPYFPLVLFAFTACEGKFETRSLSEAKCDVEPCDLGADDQGGMGGGSSDGQSENAKFVQILSATVDGKDLTQGVRGVSAQATIRIEFDRPMERASVEGAYTASEPELDPDKVAFRWSDEDKVLTIQATSPLDTEQIESPETPPRFYRISIDKSARSVSGATLSARFSAEFSTLRLTSVLIYPDIGRSRGRYYAGEDKKSWELIKGAEVCAASSAALSLGYTAEDYYPSAPGMDPNGTYAGFLYYFPLDRLAELKATSVAASLALVRWKGQFDLGDLEDVPFSVSLAPADAKGFFDPALASILADRAGVRGSTGLETNIYDIDSPHISATNGLIKVPGVFIVGSFSPEEGDIAAATPVDKTADAAVPPPPFAICSTVALAVNVLIP